MNERIPLIEVTDLKKHFVTGKLLFSRKIKYVKAVDGVNLSIYKGETLGLVGESGCGKSTIGRLILRLIDPTEGDVLFKGESILAYGREEMRNLRKKMQIIFQDPYASLNPRMTIFETVRAPLVAFNIGKKHEQMEKVIQILEVVGLSTEVMYHYPHDFSGGQRQRVAIARALILNPEFIVCDEPVSALDVSIQSQVINLMQDIQRELDLSYLFISHDLSVVKHISDNVAVMYLGKIVEFATKDELFANPIHPYTKALLSAIPIPEYRANNQRHLLVGDIPGSIDLIDGCRFSNRCEYATDLCALSEPELKELDTEHFVACPLMEKDH